MRRIPALIPTLVLCAALPAAAQVLTLTPQFSGNTVTAQIQLTGGVEADLSIVFEQAVGLNSNAVGLTAALVSPSDPTLASRLPTGVSIPGAFPVLVHVDPTAASTLSLSGVYRFFLHTHNLTLVTNSPLRLYKSHAGGPFQDITTSLEMGSVRAGGTEGNMSEFLIVADVQPTDAVIASKFDALQSALSANASSMPAAVASDLQQRLSNARSFYTAGSLTSAISAIADFSDQVKQQSGANIPDVWRANGSLVNVAGLLRAGAETLKYSLTAKANGAP